MQKPAYDLSIAQVCRISRCGTLLALVAISFCSCQSVTMRPQAMSKSRGQLTGPTAPKRVPGGASEKTHLPSHRSPSPIHEPGLELAALERAHPAGMAAMPPPAFGRNWCADDYQRPPIEEFVCNGGDHQVQVQVKRDWSVQGLHMGDTVVHYDTVDGRTVVEPSNDVCVYAPRFASVRKVYGLVAHEQHDKVAGVELPVGTEERADLGQPTTVLQPVQAGRKHAFVGMQSFREKTRGAGIDNQQRAATTEEKFLPFEDFAIMRRGAFDNAEKPRLSERLLAAVTWSTPQSLQVLIDNKTAVEATGTSAAESVYTYEMPPGKSRLRVVKIASKQNARPGDLIEFTLRFDNVGDQVIGNVTVLDKLHDRLEYVSDTARCSLPAEFLTEDEEGLPRTLRWEITDPLKVGEGGLIRFTCRVR